MSRKYIRGSHRQGGLLRNLAEDRSLDSILTGGGFLLLKASSCASMAVQSIAALVSLLTRMCGGMIVMVTDIDSDDDSLQADNAAGAAVVYCEGKVGRGQTEPPTPQASEEKLRWGKGGLARGQQLGESPARAGEYTGPWRDQEISLKISEVDQQNQSSVHSQYSILVVLNIMLNCLPCYFFPLKSQNI